MNPFQNGLHFPQRKAYLLFWVSGFTALLLETVWAKEACLLFGNTSFAYATVVGAFMAGLALGSFWFGRQVDRKPTNELLLYGKLELGVAICAILFPIALNLLKPVYLELYPKLQHRFIALSLLRLCFSGALLLAPTFLMGGTFPVLSKWLSRQPGGLQTFQSRLYASNLFGATAGALLAGFAIIPWMGLHLSASLAAAMNALLFALVWVWAQGGKNQDLSPGAESIPLPALRLTGSDLSILAIAVWHGFAAFTAQMMWTRMLILVFGSSTYAFSTILTVYLLGLGIGTWVVAKIIKRNLQVTGWHIGWTVLGFAAASTLVFPLLEWILYFFTLCTPWFHSAPAVQFFWQFLFAAAALLLPASLMGMVYPAILAYWTRRDSPGSATGLTYALNTVGGVVGALASVFLLVPFFGVVGTLKGALFLTAGFGLLLILFLAPKEGFAKRAAVPSVIVAVMTVVLFYPWDKSLFTSGVFIYGPSYVRAAQKGKEIFQKSLRETNPLIFYREGISSTVSVSMHSDLEDPSQNSKSLRVNGKTDASTSGDMATQLYCAYLPLFAHPKPESVLVIGLGSGVTVGGTLQFDSVKQVRFVEIEPAVIEANRYFAAENHYALADPRVIPTVGDGRNHLAFGSESYDVIISEPSNPWISGVSSLFTTENYEAALARLKPDGVFCQWFHAYQMSTRDFVMVFRTFAAVFPEVNLFQVSAGDYILIGSAKPIAFDRNRVDETVTKSPAVLSDLSIFTEHQIGFLEGTFLFSNRDFRSAIDRIPTPLNTDDRLRLEYSAPRFLHTETITEIERWIYSIAKKDFLPSYTPGSLLPNRDRDRLVGEFQYTSGVKALASGHPEVAIQYFREAMKLGAIDAYLFEAMGKAHEIAGRYRAAHFNYQRTQGSAMWDERVKYLDERAGLKQAMRLNPVMARDAKNYRALANLSFEAQELLGALNAFEQAIAVNPLDPRNYTDLAMLMTFTGDIRAAEKFLSKAEGMAPGNPDVLRARQVFENLIQKENFQAKLQEILSRLEANEFAAALKTTERTIQKFPNHPVLLELKSRIERKMGRTRDADASSQKAAALREKLVTQT